MTGRPRAPGGFPAREAELGRIRVVLSAAREGDGALVVDGERGIGRTALLERVCGALEGERLLRVTGPEFEATFSYAALHTLCAPLMSRLDRLPEPQRDALRVVFGPAEGDAPDRFLVCLAVLGAGPVVRRRRGPAGAPCDRRRAVAGPCLRADPRLRRAPRGQRTDRHGLRAPRDRKRPGAPGGPAPPDPRRPVPRGGRDAPRVGVPRPPEPAGPRTDPGGGAGQPPRAAGTAAHRRARPGGGRLRTAPGGAALPPHRGELRTAAATAAARTLPLVVAVEATGDTALVWAAADLLGVGPDAFAPAEAADLTASDGGLRSRRPLIGSVVYRTDSPAERRRVHEVLSRSLPRGFPCRVRRVGAA